MLNRWVCWITPRGTNQLFVIYWTFCNVFYWIVVYDNEHKYSCKYNTIIAMWHNSAFCACSTLLSTGLNLVCYDEKSCFCVAKFKLPCQHNLGDKWVITFCKQDQIDCYCCNLLSNVENNVKCVQNSSILCHLDLLLVKTT